MASAVPSNSYYQSNVYPLIADFLDDFDYAQDSNTTTSSTREAPHSGDNKRSGKMSASFTTSSSNNPVVTADLLDGENDRYLPQQQYNQSTPNLSSCSNSMKSSRRNYSESSIQAQNDIVAVAQPVTFQDNTNQTQLIYLDNNNNYYNDPYNATTTTLTVYNKEQLPPKVQRFKQKRKIRTAVSTGAGVAVGGIVAGPLGMVVGGYGAYAISKSVGKHRERKMLEKCLNDEAGVKGANWETISRAVVT